MRLIGAGNYLGPKTSRKMIMEIDLERMRDFQERFALEWAEVSSCALVMSPVSDGSIRTEIDCGKVPLDDVLPLVQKVLQKVGQEVSAISTFPFLPDKEGPVIMFDARVSREPR